MMRQVSPLPAIPGDPIPPIIQTGYQNIESLIPPEPPTITDEQAQKGGHALRRLKNYSDNLYHINMKFQSEICIARSSLQSVKQEKQNLLLDLQQKNNIIAELKKQQGREYLAARTQRESEELLSLETAKRKKAEGQIQDLKSKIQAYAKQIEKYRAEVKTAVTKEENMDHVIDEKEHQIHQQAEMIKDLEFVADELRVELIVVKRRNEDLEKAMIQTAQQNDYLSKAELTYREENVKLQKRLREVIDENKMVTANYNAIKNNHDLKRAEFEQLATEVEEAKNACQIAIRQKKQLQEETNSLTKERNDLQEKNKSIEALLLRKEKDISDLLTKVNDTINDYELKLERKEEQMWAMNMQLTEEQESAKQKHHVEIDPELINDMEKKWQVKERQYLAEVDRLTKQMFIKEESVTKLSQQVEELSKKQFQPRMEKLKAIEQDVKIRMEEYALAEERLETGFICPRDLIVLEKPVTFDPCGHTYCKKCVDSIREENFNKLKCPSCLANVDYAFRNMQMEAVCEQFLKRKSMTLSFLEWIKTLKIHLPERD